MGDTTATVLVVDDQPEIRKLVTAMLSRRGYIVLSAESELEALRLLEQNPAIELVLADVVTGKSSGVEIGAKLVAIRRDLKVLLMSGYDRESLAERYGVKAETPILTKPFTMAQLDAAVTAVLAG